MTQVVHKYPLELAGRSIISLPAKARVLSVGNQHENLELWVAVPTRNDGLEPVTRQFDSVMTGEEIPEGYSEFLGTVLFHGGSFVCHVFETTP